MSQFSNYLENALINVTLRATAYTAPTTVYLALFTTDPADDASGTEVSTGGYARQAVAFDAPSNGVTQNTAAETFTASGASWGSITHVGVFDALTVGNLLYYSALTTAKTVADGDSITFAIGSVVVTLA